MIAKVDVFNIKLKISKGYSLPSIVERPENSNDAFAVVRI